MGGTPFETLTTKREKCENGGTKKGILPFECGGIPLKKKKTLSDTDLLARTQEVVQVRCKNAKGGQGRAATPTFYVEVH